MTKEQVRLIFMAVYNYIAKTYDFCHAWRYHDLRGFPELYRALSKTFTFGINETIFHECVEFALRKFRAEVEQTAKVGNDKLKAFSDEFLSFTVCE